MSNVRRQLENSCEMGKRGLQRPGAQYLTFPTPSEDYIGLRGIPVPGGIDTYHLTELDKPGGKKCFLCMRPEQGASDLGQC